jgi:putative copper resistance protein D
MTGVFNSWILTGSVHALIATAYGQLLLFKIALFLVMVLVAAINRLRFTPRLLQDLEYASAQNASRQLRRNATIEAMIGIIILVIVAILGIMSPEIPEMDNNQ